MELEEDEFDEDADVGDAPTIFPRQTTAYGLQHSRNARAMVTIILHNDLSP